MPPQLQVPTPLAQEIHKQQAIRALRADMARQNFAQLLAADYSIVRQIALAKQQTFPIGEDQEPDPELHGATIDIANLAGLAIAGADVLMAMLGITQPPENEQG